MKRIEIHRAWAPADGAWSPWVKPVLFAAIDEDEDVPPAPMPRAPEWLAPEVIVPLEETTEPPAPYRGPRALRDTAVVIDAPADEGAKLGVVLTEHGFRPIPLYNALSSPLAIIDVRPLIRVLAESAEHVAKASLTAPPAFLLHAERMGRGLTARPGHFDNRAVCRASDFPSSERLRQAGIRRVVLLMDAIQEDFAPIALEWQASGLALWRRRSGERAAPFTMRAPWLGQRLWSWLVRPAFHSSADGAYGKLIEEPAAG